MTTHVQTINQQLHTNRAQGYDQIHRISVAYKAVPQWINPHTLRLYDSNTHALDIGGLNRWTTLGLAARDNDCLLIMWCIANGADIEKGCGRGYTPLILASFYGNYNAVAALLYNGANVHALTDSGCDALAKAVRGREKNARQGRDFIGVQMYREVIGALTNMKAALALCV